MSLAAEGSGTGQAPGRRPNTVLPSKDDTITISKDDLQSWDVPSLREFADKVLGIPLPKRISRENLLRIVLSAGK